MVKGNRELERGGIILFVLFTVANGINYLYQIIMGRMLSVEDFGTLNSLLSLFMMTAVPSGAITALVAKYLVEYKAVGKTELFGVFIYRAMKAALLGFVVVSIIGILLSPSIAQYLNIDSIALITIVMLLISLNLFVATAMGVFQGLKQFLTLGLLGALLPILKLSLGVLFVWLGFRLFGALTAVAVAIVFTLAVSLVYVKRKIDFRDHNHILLDNAAYVRFFISAFSISACMAVLMNMDMLLIKHYLLESEAGLYSPVMVLARIILYAPSALVQVMYPLVVESNVKNPKDTYKLILKALFITTIIIVFCMIVLWMGSSIALQILFGEKYLASVSFILPACLFIVPIAYLTLLMNYSIAIGNTKFLTITMAVGCVINLILVGFYHSGINQILTVMTIVNLTIVLVNMLSLGLEYRGISVRKGQQI